MWMWLMKLKSTIWSILLLWSKISKSIYIWSLIAVNSHMTKSVTIVATIGVCPFWKQEQNLDLGCVPKFCLPFHWFDKDLFHKIGLMLPLLSGKQGYCLKSWKLFCLRDWCWTGQPLLLFGFEGHCLCATTDTMFH